VTGIAARGGECGAREMAMPPGWAGAAAGGHASLPMLGKHGEAKNEMTKAKETVFLSTLMKLFLKTFLRDRT